MMHRMPVDDQRMLRLPEISGPLSTIPYVVACVAHEHGCYMGITSVMSVTSYARLGTVLLLRLQNDLCLDAEIFINQSSRENGASYRAREYLHSSEI